jgi:hypothetical protein
LCYKVLDCCWLLTKDKFVYSFELYYSFDAMDPAPNNNQQEPEEDGCELCGFMIPDFRDDEDVDRNGREMQDPAEGASNSTYNRTFGQQVPIRNENRARSTFNIEDIGPMWLQGELKQLFPEARNPG